MVVGRALAGIFAAAPMTNAGGESVGLRQFDSTDKTGSISDLWSPNERGLPLAFFSNVLFMGPCKFTKLLVELFLTCQLSAPSLVVSFHPGIGFTTSCSSSLVSLGSWSCSSSAKLSLLLSSASAPSSLGRRPVMNHSRLSRKSTSVP